MWLTKACGEVLSEMVTAEARDDLDAAELVCEGAWCWLGERRVHRMTERRLLQIMALRDCTDDPQQKVRRYTINEMGRAVLRRPAVIQDLVRVLIVGGAWKLNGDQIEMLDGPVEPESTQEVKS